MTTQKLTLNTEIKATARATGVALFNALLPQREDIGNRNFRTLLLDRIRTEINSGSAPTVYNHAKQDAIAKGLTPDFSRAVGEPIGKVQELDDKVEAKIHALFDKAVIQANKDAQAADLAERQAQADSLAAKEKAKAAKEKLREENRAKRIKDMEDAKATKAKKREEAKALKLKEKEDAKNSKEEKIKADKAAAKKVADEQPDMKWQLVNKETDKIVEYAPDRKVGLELKKARKDADNIKVVKIPATA